MKVSELIERLQEIQEKEEKDLDVVVMPYPQVGTIRFAKEVTRSFLYDRVYIVLHKEEWPL